MVWAFGVAGSGFWGLGCRHLEFRARVLKLSVQGQSSEIILEVRSLT